jgi:peptidoglycan/xylan/chitin deacetylase (PgdA/CDA1 family)
VRIVALLYHDVVADDESYAVSGFAGADADIYKLRRHAFAEHLAAVSAAAPPEARSVEALLAAREARATIFTFDDGGVGAAHHTAPMLESAGWRGHFFITTDHIGAPGFMHEAQLRALAEAGHVLGSHSCSHPARMSHLPAAEMRREWRDSVRRLEDVLGTPVRTGSVPAGFYSPAVADAAREAGIRVLFTSEPTAAIGEAGGCTVLGRFSVMRATSSAAAADLAADRRLPQLRQAAYWNAKKLVKRVGGERWLAARRWVLRRS